MEALKRRRKVLRTSFTKHLNAYNKMVQSEAPEGDIVVAFSFLEEKASELDNVDKEFMKLMYASEDFSEETYDREVTSNDEYQKKFKAAQYKEEQRTAPNRVPQQQAQQVMPQPTVNVVQLIESNTCRLPKLQLKVFPVI